MASDAFQNYGIAEGIKENGNYRYQPMSVAGGFKDVAGTHYPVIYHLSVLIHYIGGIKVYDALILQVILFLLSISLTVYLIIRRYGKKAAFIALPLTILVSYGKFSSSVTWGQHGIITGSVFLAALLWTLATFGMDKIALIVIFLSGAFYGHPPEFVFGIIFIIIYFLMELVYKKLTLEEVKNVLIVFAVTAIIISYFFIILKFSWVEQGFSKLDFVTVQKFLEGRAFPAILLLKDFNILVLIFAFTGILVSITLLFKKRNTAILAILFLFLVCLSNYTGFGHKAFQQRLLWPIYLSGFFGIGVYFILKLVFKKSLILYSSSLFIILLITFFSLYSGKTTAGSMMDKYHWDGFEWIRQNIEKDDPVYFFYQDMITQRSIYYASSQRKSYVLEVDDFINAARDGIIKRYYKFTMSAEGGAGLPYRKSFFNYGSHMPELTVDVEKPKDICSMKYIVYDKVSRQQPLANYNLLIMNELMKNGWVEEVYSNPVVSILKNNKPGEDCIVEQRISK